MRKKRDIYWPDLGKRRATPVYNGELLANGNKIAGPGDRRDGGYHRRGAARARGCASTSSAISR